ncbi:chorismate-binding protein [Fluviicola chungangensis]|uniref:Anthranilate synthase component I family protein n=1 Tax=Fluviicola chungangensis TaxID=2597671 RepID=A0A556MY24_9FLAO|nr:anthranilate synthase component I family protein [Fluviicola chungangensis]TSJ44733.1 anthranilate synthase component I family protein [Fluviicola chungangensis]
MVERALFRYKENSFLVGIGCESEFLLHSDLNWNALDTFLEKHEGRTLFTVINYQLGLDILSVPHAPNQLPLLRVWVPESTYLYESTTAYLLEGKHDEMHQKLAEAVFETRENAPTVQWKAKIDQTTYLERIQQLKEHIQLGDIYELNFCQLIESQPITLHSIQPFFNRMWELNPTPFAGMVETERWMLASASPERFIQKKGSKLISQPIKGTAPRGKTEPEDMQFRNNLQASPKERAENVMIVDLVRNDLSRVATKGSVHVEELCGIYSFPTVHQMISTISCELKEKMSLSEILKAAFPMGSMTGAPKKSAVELAEKYEGFSREFYSGSFGVIYPNMDFDLNVLIRTLVYDHQTKKLSCGVGGAITMLSDPQAEYEECRFKVDKILSLFGTCQW